MAGREISRESCTVLALMGLINRLHILIYFSEAGLGCKTDSFVLLCGMHHTSIYITALQHDKTLKQCDCGGETFNDELFTARHIKFCVAFKFMVGYYVQQTEFEKKRRSFRENEFPQ